MRTSKLILVVILLLSITTIFAQNSQSSWTKWHWLIGEWVGEGKGQPGQGDGRFSFQPDLNKNILVRKAYSSYPATKDKPAIVHEDLLIVYMNPLSLTEKAIYFDNENHVINYNVAVADSTIVFLSEKMMSMPVFRLTYKLVEAKKATVKFEISGDGVNFRTYVEGKSIKKE